jgi:SPP1 gp7 family putative phage head morphogenesis protein
MADQALPIDVPPAEAIAWFRAKGYQFGFSWQDVEHEEHGRGFTVAKAMTRDILETLREAVDRAIAEGETLQMFAKQLRPRLEAAGWWGRKEMVDPATGESELVQLGSPRRLKTIFETNMRTSYAAGRWERIERNRRAFPFLEYVSVMDGRERPQHHAWHGTVLPVDHPWWDTHYPPNGWGCRCLPKPISRGQAERRGLKVTEPQVFPMRQWINKRTGEIHMIERGIDPGWAYHVGKARSSGITPDPYTGGGLAAMSAASAERRRGLSAISEGDEDAVSGFLAAFGMTTRAAGVAGATFVDAGGWPVAIAASWFRGDGDRAALPAGLAAAELDDVAGAIRSPAEIRWLWITAPDAPPQLVRRYFGASDRHGAVMVVDIARWWRARRMPAGRLAAARKGVLAWSADS